MLLGFFLLIAQGGKKEGGMGGDNRRVTVSK